jgi:hypothetical protein
MKRDFVLGVLVIGGVADTGDGVLTTLEVEVTTAGWVTVEVAVIAF